VLSNGLFGSYRSNLGDVPPLLFEITGHDRVDQGREGRTLRIAALSLEDVIRYIRTGHSDLEITEIKVIGAIQVLSSSENLRIIRENVRSQSGGCRFTCISLFVRARVQEDFFFRIVAAPGKKRKGSI
jgi:hypothetical protein